MSPKLSAVKSFSKFFSSSGGEKEAFLEDDVPTPPLKSFSFRQQQELASGGRGKGKCGGGGGGTPTQNEDSVASEMDFIRELTRYRGGRAQVARQDDE